MTGMPKLQIDRRTVLKGAGTIAIALPWLEIMGHPRRTRAATVPAQRFVSVYTPGGTVLDRWRPTGTATSFVLSPILKPLEPVQNEIIVVDGLRMSSAVGEQSQSGIIAWLTGTPQGPTPPNLYARGPSLDQVLATRISAGKKKLASLQVAVRWGTGKARGRVSPIDVANYADDAAFTPIPPRLDPVLIWQELFGTIPSAATRRGWDRSILDFVDRRYAALAGRLGASDKRKIDEHLTSIREIERALPADTDPGTTCFAPTLIDTSDYNPTTGLNADDVGAIKDLVTDAAIPKVGKLMIDMLVMALACDLTAVSSLQWSDTEAKHTFPWLSLNETHNFYQNGGGYQPVQLEKIYTWYSEQHAYLLQQMARVDMGGHSLLDESVVFFGSEVQNPATHVKTDMPFLLAGNGGGLGTGRWLQYAGESHNDLLVSILNLFGDARRTFGYPQYCTGPLENIV
jgi:hypothetical protein